MENSKNTNLWIGLGVVVVIVAGLIFWAMSMGPSPYLDTSQLADSPDSVESVEDTSEGSENATSPVATISYSNALVKYKDARLQLDKVCQASPDKMAFKNNAFLMVDNRAPVARTVKVGSVFPVKAYGFKIVKLSSATLPATWYVDCDKSQNVATILIQN